MTLLKNQDDQSISYFNNFQLVRKFQFLFPTLQIELWIIPYLRNSETLGKLPIAQHIHRRGENDDDGDANSDAQRLKNHYGVEL